jgi:hypothetical protein
MYGFMNRTYLYYLLIIPLAFFWPLLHFAIFVLRFGRTPADSVLVFLPMGVVSAFALAFMLKRSQSGRRKRWTIFGYLLAVPYAFIGSLMSGLMLPPVFGTIIYGASPLVLGTWLGYRLSK